MVSVRAGLGARCWRAHVQLSLFRFGVSLTDIGGTMLQGNSIDPNDGTVSDKVPMRLRPGVGAIFAELFNWLITATFDVDTLWKLQDAQDARVFMGTEIWGFQGPRRFPHGIPTGQWTDLWLWRALARNAD